MAVFGKESCSKTVVKFANLIGERFQIWPILRAIRYTNVTSCKAAFSAKYRPYTGGERRFYRHTFYKTICTEMLDIGFIRVHRCVPERSTVVAHTVHSVRLFAVIFHNTCNRPRCAYLQ